MECCHGKATIPSIYIFVAVNNIKPLSVAMERQQYLPFIFCSCQQYKTIECCHGKGTIPSIYIFVAVNNIKPLSIAMERQQYLPFILL
jgi:hypothetical protein